MKCQKLNKQIKSNQGQGLTEYLMLVMLIAVISIAVVRSIGTQVKSKLTTVRDNIQKEIVLGE